MDIALKILAMVSMLLFIVMSTIAIISILKIVKFAELATQSLSNLDHDFKEIKAKTVELISGLDDFKDKISGTLDELSILNKKAVTSLDHFNEMSVQITESVQHIESRADRLMNVLSPFEKMVVEVAGKINPAVHYTSTLISASTKALGAFANFLKK